jgi:YebC/PmpR family DNA-binding regulatory protein
MLHEFMSGHSHWAGIKQRKGVNDAKRAKIFTKLGKPIVIAAREGGGNPDTNFKLRMAMKKAQEFNMPKDNIEKAIKKGTGDQSGVEITEAIYEGMGPGGVMMIIKTSTDNKNRTVSEIKSILTKAGGKFGEPGSSMWNFDQVGAITIDLAGKDADELELAAIEAGANDTKIDEGFLFIYTEPQDLQKVQENLLEKNIEISESNLTFLPKTLADIDAHAQESYDKLLETLDDQEDVEDIYDNL